MILSCDYAELKETKVRRKKKKNTLCVWQQLVRPANNHFVKVLKMSSFSPSGVSLTLHQTAGTRSPAAAGVDVGAAANHRQARIKRLMRRASIKRPPSHVTQHQSRSQVISHGSCCNTSIGTLSMKEHKLLLLHRAFLLLPVTSLNYRAPRDLERVRQNCCSNRTHVTWRDSVWSNRSSTTSNNDAEMTHFRQTRQTQTTKKDENVFQKGSEIFALTVEDKWLLWIWDALLT